MHASRSDRFINNLSDCGIYEEHFLNTNTSNKRIKDIFDAIKLLNNVEKDIVFVYNAF